MTIEQARPAAPQATRPTVGQRIWYSILVRRVEYQPVMIAIYLIPALLTAESFSTLLTVHFLLVIVMALLVEHVVDMVNSYADRDVDATYKARMSQAVYALGLRNMRWQIWVTAVLALVVATYLALRTGHWDVLVLAAVALYLGAQYSIGPIHLKNSGVWQIPGLAAVLIWLPMPLVVRAMPADLTWPVLAAIIGFGLNQVGIVMVNTAEDWPEDEAFGIRTCIRALGLSRAMAVATGLIAVGGPTVIVSVLVIGGFTWGAVPMIAAIAFALWHVSGTWRGVRGRSIEEGLAFLRPRAKLVPLQVATTGWGTVVAAAFVLAG